MVKTTSHALDRWQSVKHHNVLVIADRDGTKVQADEVDPYVRWEHAVCAALSGLLQIATQDDASAADVWAAAISWFTRNVYDLTDVSSGTLLEVAKRMLAGGTHDPESIELDDLLQPEAERIGLNGLPQEDWVR